MADNTAIGIAERNAITTELNNIMEHMNSWSNFISDIQSHHDSPVLGHYKADFNKGMVVVSSIEELISIMSDVRSSVISLVEDSHAYVEQHTSIDQ